MSGSYNNRGRPQGGQPPNSTDERGYTHPPRDPGDRGGQRDGLSEPQYQEVRLDGPGTAPPAYPAAPAAAAPARPPANPAPAYEPGAAAEPDTRSQRPMLGAPQEPPRELAAPPREDEPSDLSGAPIVLAGSVTGRSLTLVISIMCFFASLTAGAVYMMNQSATVWLQNMSNEITVQIEPREGVDTEKTVREVTAFLRLSPGILTVNALDKADTAKLLEPWLGNTEALADLPVPRLIAIEIDGNTVPDLKRLSTTLTEQFPNAVLDDHRKWRQQITSVTRSFALGGLAILVLVGAATVAIIISATGSAMAANRDIVEVLNFVGATDRFIAHEFEKHFLTLGIRAGFVGAVSAMLVFWSMPILMELLGGGASTFDELQRLVGVGALDPLGYILVGGVVIVIAGLCMVTSRFGVYRILHHQN